MENQILTFLLVWPPQASLPYWILPAKPGGMDKEWQTGRVSRQPTMEMASNAWMKR